MKEVLEFVKLSYSNDPEKWKPVYQLLRDSFGESFSAGITISDTENYKISKDLNLLRAKLNNNEIITKNLLASAYILSQAGTDEQIAVNTAQKILSNPNNGHYHDLIFLLEMISREIKRDTALRRIPIYAAIIAGAISLGVCLLNIAYANNTNKKIEQLIMKVEKHIPSL